VVRKVRHSRKFVPPQIDLSRPASYHRAAVAFGSGSGLSRTRTPDEVSHRRFGRRYGDSPFAKGRLESGELVWSIMTDTTDPNLANLHGVDYSPKLAYAVTGKAAREARIDKDGVIVFKSGKVDFSPERIVTPGEAPNFFPPKTAQPGSVGDADYSHSCDSRMARMRSSICRWWRSTFRRTISTRCATGRSTIPKSRIRSSRSVLATAP
jgi:hypothetical protein